MEAGMRMIAGWLVVGFLGAAAPVGAQTRDVGAMITEIKPGRGRIEVSGPGTTDWRPAGPLLALKVGDSLRATDDAAAVVVLAGPRGRGGGGGAPAPLVGAAPPPGRPVQKGLLPLQSRPGLPRRNPPRAAR